MGVHEPARDASGAIKIDARGGDDAVTVEERVVLVPGGRAGVFRPVTMTACHPSRGHHSREPSERDLDMVLGQCSVLSTAKLVHNAVHP